MRSRASGGICGDSSAAPQRGDHVELAPARDLGAAGDVDRAQLDGRARERAHDRAGVAGVDEQPQPGEQVAHLGALEERRRARQPVRHGALLERDGDRLALVADRAHEHADVLGRHVFARDQPLDLGGHRLGLRALVLAAPEGDLAAVAAAAAPWRCGPGSGSATARAAASTRSGQRWLCSSRTTVAAGHSASKSRRFLAAAPRRRWIAWSSSPAALTCAVLAREQPHQQALGEVRVLQLVDEQVAVARGDPRPHVRLRAQHAEGVEQQVAEVERPRLLEHAGRGPRRWRRTRARGRPRGRASPPTPRSPRARRARP